MRKGIVRILQCAALVCAAVFPAGAAKRVDSFTAVPALVYVSTATNVTLYAQVAPDPDLIAGGVNAAMYGTDGRPIGSAIRLYDDGTHGDVVAADGVYTSTITVYQVAPTKLTLRVSVAYKGMLQRLMSDPISLNVTERPFFTTPDPSHLVTEGGVSYPYDQLIVVLQTGYDRTDANALASGIGGSVVGYSPSAHSYTFSVPAANPAQLESTATILRSDPRVLRVFRNTELPFDAAAGTLNNDLAHLRARNSALSAQYDKIKIEEAWELIDTLKPALSPVVVGILESGVDKNHPEFSGVKFGSSPAASFTSPAAHGTTVTGIIGASNASASRSLAADSPELNGLLAGLPSSASTSGSLVDYTLEVRSSGRMFTDQASALVDELAAAGVTVINMSFGVNRCALATMNACTAIDPNWHPVSDAQFTSLRDTIGAVVQFHSNIIFVASAGNAGGAGALDASQHLPGGGVTAVNMVTVAASTVGDTRAPFSEFGANVTIAAPGVDIYAPVVYTAPLDAADYAQSGNSGTSFAAPMVTGTVGLLRAIKPALTATQIRDILQYTGDPITTDRNIGRRLNALQAVKYVTQPVDVFIVVDNTGSFGDDIATFKAGAASIVTSLVQSGLNVNMGLAHFEDYPILPWGDPSYGDRAYTRVLDLNPPTDLDHNGTLDIIEGINSLSIHYGADGNEAQLAALYQAASGAGQDVPPAGSSPADIAPGQQANWRANSLRLLILWTDAPFHVPNDSSSSTTPSFGYPGPSWAATLSALTAKNIKVIGMSATTSSDPDLRNAASGTGALAPPGGVDCNGDGYADVAQGSPMVCRIATNGAGIAKAIINSVLALGH